MSTNTTRPAQSLEGASLSQLLTTLSGAGIVALVEVTIFLLIRTKFKRIYEPKTYLGDEDRRIKPLPRTPWGWLIALLKIPQEELIRVSGMDAYFFARYLYIHALFFAVTFVAIAVILFPVYVIDGKGESYEKTGLDLLSFGNISPKHSQRYAAPLVLAYVFVSAFLYLLYSELKEFIKKRQSLLRSIAYQSDVSGATILVTAIPKRYMSEEVLFRIFNHCSGGVKRIWLNYDLKDMPDKAEERTKLVDKLETAECQWIGKILKQQIKNEKKKKKKSQPSNLISHDNEQNQFEVEIVDAMNENISKIQRPTMRTGSIPLLSSLCLGDKVDSIDYCKRRIATLNDELEHAKTNLSTYKCLNSAFIQFNRSIGAHMAMQSVASSIPLTMTPKYIDVKPKSIIWSNLKLNYYQLKLRQSLALTAATVLIVFWTIPVAFVGILSNLNYLTDKVTFLRFIHNLPPSLLGLITGLLPSILLSILLALLPIVLKLFARLSGIPTIDAIDRHVQGSYFVFQVVHGFLVITISSSITSVITRIIENPPSAATILAANIPTASNFFFSFIALKGLSDASSLLLQIVALIIFYLLGKLLDNTPRKKSRRYLTLKTLGWGTIYPIFTNLIVITLVYSIIAPLILIISAIAFFFFYVAYIYTMFYVSDFPSDSGGLAFPRAIHQSFTGIYLMELLLAGLFFLAQDDSGIQCAIPQGILMCILIFITVIIQLMMKSSFGPLTFYLPLDNGEILNNNNETNDNLPDETTNNAYLHPAFRDSKPVIWIPRDQFGIAAREVELVRSSDLNLEMSVESARFDSKQRIEVTGVPPDHIQSSKRNIVAARL